MTIREDLETVGYFAKRFYDILAMVPGAIAYGFNEMREEWDFRTQMHEENCKIWNQRDEMTRESTRILREREMRGEGETDEIGI